MPTQGSQHVLSGLRVLDFMRALAGPTCSRILVEMGADVIKVESAPYGDLGRNASVFRSKRSLVHVQPLSPGFSRFTNQVQHELDKVLSWTRDTDNFQLRSGGRLPVFKARGARSGKLQQLWIARHRPLLAR